ncbi:DUF4157 domain-containing protein [uncultured Thiodictyon sp.]|uniref:eCIS core domain-containing protein n=1 Tax=uncultured Thiodictyon sp. TaxID=1846217 RepID=UPI0025E3B782|nr:DUF4157 domain-containing protein [uncultured Thiodictyon sp.]
MGSTTSKSAPLTGIALKAPEQTTPTQTRPRPTGNQALLRTQRRHADGERTGNAPEPGATLRIGQPADPLERAADRIADLVGRVGAGGAPARQPAIPLGDGTRRQPQPLPIAPATGDRGGQPVPSLVQDVLRMPGQPLEPAPQRLMETRLQQVTQPTGANPAGDFSQVRIHTGTPAAQSAQAVAARAYTVGRDIVFGAGQYDPGSRDGQRLLAHELTHVIQGRSQAAVPTTLWRAPAGPAPAPAPEPVTKDPVAKPEADPKPADPPPSAETVPMQWTAQELPIDLWEAKLIAETAEPTTPMSAAEIEQVQQAVLKQLQTLKDRDQRIRNLAVAKAQSLLGADWHARAGSEAKKQADSLYSGDPAQQRVEALNTAMKATRSMRAAIQMKMDAATATLRSKKPGKADAAKVLAAGTELLAGLDATPTPGAEEQNVSGGASEMAWRYLGSEKTKKSLETLGISIPWFTTCVTVPPAVAKAAGVDLKKWGPLDVLDKTKAARFKQLDGQNAWIPAEHKQRPEPGDILVMVSYPMVKGEPQKDISKATFQHIAVLLEPVTENADGTENWITADGGKGASHKGEDKTGMTNRRYDPATQQFVRQASTKTYEASEGGRFLLGFWSLPRLPQVPEKPPTPDKSPGKTGTP